MEKYLTRAEIDEILDNAGWVPHATDFELALAFLSRKFEVRVTRDKRHIEVGNLSLDFETDSRCKGEWDCESVCEVSRLIDKI